MMRITILIVIFIAVCSASSFSQSKKKRKKDKHATREVLQPTTLNPLPEKEYAPPRASQKTSKGPTFESEQRYYERMEALDKTRRKNEKLMQKPQYSDPLYFGHKRPPKKRKPGKMKYCRECGIRH